MENETKRYVLGFKFYNNNGIMYAVLIEKKRPEYIAGFLNGIGGKIEENERPIDAMVRNTRKRQVSKSKRKNGIILPIYI